MPPRPPALLSWSSGKDSAWALHVLRAQNEVDVVGLVTTVNSRYDRVAMHGVRRALLEAQAAAAGLPLWIVEIPSPCTNEQYEAAMAGIVARAVGQGIHLMAFGDLFLEDIRAYRVDRLRGTGVDPLFPLWAIPTDQLAARMVAGGLRAKVTCIDPRALRPSFVGRDFDADFVAALPPTVDPCGERGEFHSFAYAGPMFSQPIAVTVGEVVERDGFVFADVLPAA